ncbi:hypothetical protein KC19_2G246000 [Ceratodon purpureus]|uniref:Uncharacterized protein n=1 Tax=Ceratodon purpureus TaxID=3225 RepID=A0A8T0J022_CERPU|nr:hypothetical protein KC19_2G246000 [Ceratodon purpureus]
MYSFQAMRVARTLLCSRAWASVASACHEAHSIRSMIHIRGNDVIQTALGPSSCLYRSLSSRPVFWECRSESFKHLQRSSKLFGVQSCTGTFLGLAVASSFLAAEQEAVRCENHHGFHDGFRENQQVQEITEMITDDSSDMETEHKLLSFVKRYWWPTIFLLTVVLGYPYPKSLLPNSLLLIWSTKPNPASIYLWLKKRSETSRVKQGALDVVKEKINSTATVMHVEVQDYMLFCLAKVTYLTSNATMIGVLGDWWVVYSSSSSITALGLSLDNVPNLDNIATGIANDFRSKKEELEAEFKKATEDGLKKYKNWIEKLRPGVSWVN